MTACQPQATNQSGICLPIKVVHALHLEEVYAYTHHSGCLLFHIQAILASTVAQKLGSGKCKWQHYRMQASAGGNAAEVLSPVSIYKLECRKGKVIKLSFSGANISAGFTETEQAALQTAYTRDPALCVTQPPPPPLSPPMPCSPHTTQ